MYHHYQTGGIFLGKENRGEANQLFFIFTEQFGAIEVLARAIRKITSKLRSDANLFSLAQIEFIQGKNYKTLTDIVTLDKWSLVRQDTAKLALAQKISQVIAQLIIHPQKDSQVWELLLQCFYFLNGHQPVVAIPQNAGEAISVLAMERGIASRPAAARNDYDVSQLVYYYFLWNLLKLLGYSPQLYNCPLCGERIKPQIFYLAPQAGGLVCGPCASRLNVLETPKEFIKVNTVKLLRIFLQKPITILSRLKIEEQDIANLADICQFQLNHFQANQKEL
jgi:DNA repair protein RecO (recombination protein O)